MGAPPPSSLALLRSCDNWAVNTKCLCSGSVVFSIIFGGICYVVGAKCISSLKWILLKKFLRKFIVSEVFLAFELNKLRFESESLGVGTWKYILLSVLQFYEMRAILYLRRWQYELREIILCSAWHTVHGQWILVPLFHLSQKQIFCGMKKFLIAQFLIDNFILLPIILGWPKSPFSFFHIKKDNFIFINNFIDLDILSISAISCVV